MIQVRIRERTDQPCSIRRGLPHGGWINSGRRKSDAQQQQVWRFLPIVIGTFLVLVGSTRALAGLGYISETPISDSYAWAAFGVVATIAGLILIASVSLARLRLSRVKELPK